MPSTTDTMARSSSRCLRGLREGGGSSLPHSVERLDLIYQLKADNKLSFLAYKNERTTFGLKRIWLGVDCLNLFGINNVNSYYWVTDVSNQQYAVPNYLTGRLINAKVSVEL